MANMKYLVFFLQILVSAVSAIDQLSGLLHGNNWPTETNRLTILAALPSDPCDNSTCGTNTICSATYSPVCQCLHGFVAKSDQEWNQGHFQDGCVRQSALNCSSDGFFLLHNVKLPDVQNDTSLGKMSLDECKNWCSKNCSCLAYAINGEGNCVAWFNSLDDIRSFQDGNDLYYRLSGSEIGPNDPSSNTSSKKNHMLVPIIVPVLFVLVLTCISLLIFLRRRRRRKRNTRTPHLSGKQVSSSLGDKDDELELPLFDKHTIRNATNDFSFNSLLGEGGYGPVYKGQLADGKEIAVKRLSRDSLQGLTEFKTEVSLIAKVQHRNLVQLLGCCIEDEERMLIYELLQNTSLDSFIFDKNKAKVLDWRKRIEIITGIARGVLYLHQDSRLKVIHRDLKTSNILLDKDMNPKISDFGMARIFKVGQVQENTLRVVGTYGYMAPEYAMYGIYSEKSDVFSFGVILLEILTGKKNRVVTQSNHPLNLLGHAWKLWNDGKCLELLDKSIGSSYIVNEVERYVKVGLLCVQESSEDRPMMADVVLMLRSETVKLPRPKQPGFCVPRTSKAGETSSSNEISVTILDGR